MPKLGLSDALAIVGLVFAIVLLVLDKAGKLKGPVLLILLAVAAVMTLPLALGNDWVGNAPTGMLKFSRVMLMVCCVGLAYSIIAVWISDETPTSLADKEKEIPVQAEPKPNVVQEPPSPHPPSEMERRQALLEKLRQEYILSHDNLSAALIAGMEQPPADWINQRLAQLGETWAVRTPAKPHQNESVSGGREEESVARVRGLIAEGNRIVQTCQSVPDPYHTPAAERADLANLIVEFENRTETVLSLDPDPRPQKMWRDAVLYGVPEKTPSIATYCTQLNVKMEILNRILVRKTTSRQKLRSQLERFVRQGVSLRAISLKGPAAAGQVLDQEMKWVGDVMKWLGDNFDENYQNQFNNVAPSGEDAFQNYPENVKGMCERMQPRIEVLESIEKEIASDTG